MIFALILLLDEDEDLIGIGIGDVTDRLQFGVADPLGGKAAAKLVAIVIRIVLIEDFDPRHRAAAHRTIAAEVRHEQTPKKSMTVDYPGSIASF